MKETKKRAPVATDTPERTSRLEFLRKAVREFKTEDFGTPETGCTLTDDFGKAPQGGKPETYPKKGSHPRVLFNEKDIPFIISSVERSADTAYGKKFREYLSTDITGILPEPTLNRRGFHNWDGQTLAAIQAHAMAYAVYGDEFYGYSAIYAIKNYLLTLDVDYIYSDQCREFGMVMYIAACVFDWCHALLSDEDKIQIPLGVEHKLCRGSVKNTRNGIFSTSSPVKMEMGFPPAKQSAVVGHGAEYQLQRDYLSMAIAVFDEYPSWYEFVGGRFFGEYVKPRRMYYEAKLYPQGLSVYAPGRFGADCYGAILIQAATGISPYSEDMAGVVFTFVSNETSTLNMFSTGDGASTKLPTSAIAELALKTSHVLADTDSAPLLRLIVKRLASERAFTNADVKSVLASEGIIYHSREVAELEGDWRDYLPRIWYNGGYVGQYVSRSEWGDNAAVTMMRVGERFTANHDHDDAGTFQIHYKGLTSGSSGGYRHYGSTHFKCYHQATVSKNGLLIFDQKLVEEPRLVLGEDGNPVIDPSYGNVRYENAMEAFYSGGQRANRTQPASLAQWLSGRYDRAVVTGHAHAYREDGKTPIFSYISSDITRAYQTTQAFFVGRSMLTLFTNDENYPMALIVYDKIINSKHGLVDKFLLQINGESAPEIDEENKTVAVEDGEGRLVLKNLIGAGKIEGIGGGYEHNYVINGINCQDNSFAAQNSWGRVEITIDTPNSAPWINDKKSLNVMYVTDKGNTAEFPIYPLGSKCGSFDGAAVANSAILFSTSMERVAQSASFTVPGEGYVTCYVAGLLGGEWTVSYGDKIESYTVSEESGLLTFTAPAGIEISFSM